MFAASKESLLPIFQAMNKSSFLVWLYGQENWAYENIKYIGRNALFT